MIAANSRYAQSTVVPAVSLDGTDVRVILFPQPLDRTVQFSYYQVKGADNIDQIASRFYGSPTLWWLIANANPEILYWAVLPTGYLLRIPTVASAS